MYEYQVDGTDFAINYGKAMAEISFSVDNIVGLWLEDKVMMLEVNQPPNIYGGICRRHTYRGYGGSSLQMY